MNAFRTTQMRRLSPRPGMGFACAVAAFTSGSAAAGTGGATLSSYVLTRLVPSDKCIVEPAGTQSIRWALQHAQAESASSIADASNTESIYRPQWFIGLGHPPAVLEVYTTDLASIDTRVVPLPGSAGLALAAVGPFAIRRRR
ncbi:MAG: hypothetical protein ACTS22_00760 [Phycisphaerales bacterium]